MRKPFTAIAILVALSVPAWAEHLVPAEAARQQAVDFAAARDRDRAAVEAFVASSDGASALAHLGLEPSAVRAGLGGLSDAELRDLASRAEALRADPVAGELNRQVIWIGAISLALILLIILIA
jgi:hypothetical protein